MEENIEQKIVEKLDILIRLVAVDALRNQSFREQVTVLSEIGLQPKEIAAILGRTPNNVSVTLHAIRKEKKGIKGPK